jgi:two-component system response regulator RstA
MDRDALLKNLRGVSYDGMDRSVTWRFRVCAKSCRITPPYRIKTVRNKGYLFAPRLGNLIAGSITCAK